MSRSAEVGDESTDDLDVIAAQLNEADMNRARQKSPGPVMRSDKDVFTKRVQSDIAVERTHLDQNEIVVAKHCTQCDVDCFACTMGDHHMNIEKPYSGYRHEDTVKINWPDHNAKGHHHILWNGVENETVKCGSERCNELAVMIMEERARDDVKKDQDPRSDANRRQVGGQHYGLGVRQHWDVVTEFDLDYFQGQITKYVFRWDKKNGLQDLEKARHYLDKYIEEIQAGRIPKWIPPASTLPAD